MNVEQTTLSEQGKKTSRVLPVIQCQSKAETVVRSEWFYENETCPSFILQVKQPDLTKSHSDNTQE